MLKPPRYYYDSTRDKLKNLHPTAIKTPKFIKPCTRIVQILLLSSKNGPKCIVHVNTFI